MKGYAKLYNKFGYIRTITDNSYRYITLKNAILDDYIASIIMYDGSIIKKNGICDAVYLT